jgi:hypothetical protein
VVMTNNLQKVPIPLEPPLPIVVINPNLEENFHTPIKKFLFSWLGCCLGCPKAISVYCMLNVIIAPCYPFWSKDKNRTAEVQKYLHFFIKFSNSLFYITFFHRFKFAYRIVQFLILPYPGAYLRVLLP